MIIKTWYQPVRSRLRLFPRVFAAPFKTGEILGMMLLTEISLAY
jgi:hypothetical protein